MPIAYLEDLVVGPGRELDERRKRLFLALSIVIGAPAASIFALVDLAAGRATEGLSTLTAVAALLIVLLLLRRVRNVLRIFRVVFVLILTLMASALAIGGGEGYAFLWFYFIPLSTFYLAGTREGLAWVGASITLATAVFLGGLGPHAYPLAMGVRFLVTYAIVVVLAYGLESSRRRWYEQLQREKEALREALAQVKTLRGLLPICASCKRVRDDQGYWMMLDHYLEEHAHIGLSHGLCPECSKALYPQFAAEATPAQRPTEGGSPPSAGGAPGPR